jgi:hypothetical protein
MKRAVVATYVFLLATGMVMAQTSGSMGNTQDQSSQISGGTAQTVDGCLSRSGADYILTASDGSQYLVAGDTSPLSAHVGHEVAITGGVSQGASSGAMNSPNGSIAMQSFKHVAAHCPGASSAMPSSTGGMAGATSSDTRTEQQSSLASPPVSSDTNASGNSSNQEMAQNNQPVSSPQGAMIQSQGAVNPQPDQGAPPSTSNMDSGSTGMSSGGQTASEQPGTDLDQSTQSAPAMGSDQGNMGTPSEQSDMDNTGGSSDQGSMGNNEGQASGDQGSLPRTASPLPLIGLLGLGSLASGLLFRRRK